MKNLPETPPLAEQRCCPLDTAAVVVPPTDPWAPGVRAVDVPGARAEQRCPSHSPEGAQAGAGDPFIDFVAEIAARGADNDNDDWDGWPEEAPPDKALPTDIATRTFKITLFEDKTAARKWVVKTTLLQLVDQIQKWTAANKKQLPWLKLAEFGNQRSAKGSLRRNENVQWITGIEGEHDAGTMTFDEALTILRETRIRCIAYTSPSYVPGTAERWRILVPLSRERHAPETRAGFVARLNGLLGGKLSGESFTLSQAYLFGSVDNNPDHRVEVVDGDFLDLRDDTFAGSVFRDGSKVGTATPRLPRAEPGQPREGAQQEERGKIVFALDTFSSTCGYFEWLKVAAALFRELGDDGFALFDSWSAKATGKASDGTPMYTTKKCQERWNGARTMTDVNISTLFFYADQADPTWRGRYDHSILDCLVVAKNAPAPAHDGGNAAVGDAGNPEGNPAGNPGGTPAAAASASEGVTIDDFYAYMPTHAYIFVPTRAMWPAASVNARLRGKTPIKGPAKGVSPAVAPAIAATIAAAIAAAATPATPATPATSWKPKKPRKQKGENLIPPSQWLDEHRPVEAMTWAPGEPPIIKNRLIVEAGWIERNGVATFNLYRPPVVRVGNSANADRWIELVERIYPNDVGHIITYCAHRIQRPAEKINHGILLSGSTGIGKDTMLEPLKLGVGPWNFKEASPQDVMGSYNDFIECVVLRISEAHDLGEINRYSFHDHTKTIMAAPPDVLRVNAKYVPQHYVVNVAGTFLTTNNRFDSVYLPANDRRTYVAWSELVAEEFAEGFWSGIWAWYGAGGLEDVVAYLAEYDLSKFNPKAPPKKTDAFWQIVGVSAPPEESELMDALDALGAKEGARDADGRACGPVVTTISKIAASLPQGLCTEGGLYGWLLDRKNSRTINHRLERCGYVPVRNDSAKDGYWVIGGKRQRVFGRANVSATDRIIAARALR